MFRIIIKGDKWRVYIYNEETFIRKFGGADAAFVVPDQRKMVFNREELNLETVLHELWHAYTTYLHLKSAVLEVGQIEEIFAEMFGNDGPAMIQQGKRLYAKLKKFDE